MISSSPPDAPKAASQAYATAKAVFAKAIAHPQNRGGIRMRELRHGRRHAYEDERVVSYTCCLRPPPTGLSRAMDGSDDYV